MKLVDYGSDSESEDSQEQQEPQKVQDKSAVNGKDEQKQQNNTITVENNGEKQSEDGKKKITIKYRDLPKFLTPKIHKEEKKDLWQPKSIAQIQNDRKKKIEDLSESNDKKGKLTNLMRLSSPKHKLQNEEVSSYNLKKQQTGQPILPSYINPETLFNENIDQNLVEQYDQDDIYINKRYQNVEKNSDAGQREVKYAVNREINNEELEFIETDAKNMANIKVSEISREQIIGDYNWLQNYQKQKQQNILKQGYKLDTQIDKTQKSKNQLSALAIDAIANQDYLEQQRTEQMRNAKRKRDRYG